MDDVAAHLQALIGGRDDHDTPAQEDVELLSVAIRAATDPAHQPSERLDAPDGVVFGSSSTSVWDAVINEDDSSVQPARRKGKQRSSPDTHQTSQTSDRLRAYALQAADGDAALSSSTLASVEACLAKEGTGGGAEETSIMLAEILGFDQLDLVEAVVKERQRVLQDLRMATTESQVGEDDVESTARPPRRPPASSTPAIASTSKPYAPTSNVVIHTKAELELNKRRRAEQRRLQRAHHHAAADDDDDDDADPNTLYTAEEMAMLRAQSLQAAAERPLFTSDRVASDEPKYPHVFMSGAAGNVLNAFGSKFSLPLGTTRQDREYYEEVTIPPPRQLPMRTNERLMPISEMDALAKGAFPGYTSLNRLQSVVYRLGYGSNENLLVCAPTGAGKTDVAMLTVLRTITQHARTLNGRSATHNAFDVQYDDFKIIYVAPMKALASEIVGKFSKRLRYLGVKVRELTGDMQMTRKEIAETQMIVTTPEKWDVVTRKPTGEGELVAKVKLLIIDEVHLLHEERGAVIETIVARTLRLVESSQSLIRIVGLSATLPNYIDVADFLRVNRYKGLFFFDSSFRPVPLEQHFLGIKGKAGSPVARQRMDKATFEKVQELVEQGHQIMIFVHARKETVKTAYGMRDMCREEGVLEAVTQAREEGNPDHFRREIMESRNRELKELYETGFGIHHAGMLRKDRNLSERLFETGVTRVLCCTSTLAWGVNLPAYAVLIKGTDIYDSSLGRFSDLSILDVLQIFGRAGRPQYEKVGVGYILTSHDKLSHYVDTITAQHPIESKFKGGLIDALNAEASLGSVNSITDGVTWLSYTYMFTRMRRNPLAYGMLADEVLDDPQLGAKRLHEITAAAAYLGKCGMLDVDGGRLSVTALGRIAARYYITYRTVEVFNEKLRNNMTEADLLSVFGHATDFEQVVPRESEIQELKKLQAKVPCEIVGACDTPSGKANLLLQANISRLYIDDFALVSDAGYVWQNAGRVMRALFETALTRQWAGTAAAALGLTRSIERRLWPFDHPLAQSPHLRPDMVHQLSRWADEVEIKQLATMSNDEIATLCRVNARHADAIRQAARRFPLLAVQYSLRPMTYDLLRIDVVLHRDYDWHDNDAVPESFYVWIEDEDGVRILQSKRVLFHARSAPTQPLSFTIDRLLIAASRGVSIRWISERWLGAEDVVFAPFDALRMADAPQPFTALLELPLLGTAQIGAASETTLGPAGEAIAQRVPTLNALQTQAYADVVSGDDDVLCAMPHRAGRSLLAHMAVCRAVQRVYGNAGAVVLLVVHPSVPLAQQARQALRKVLVGVDTRLVKSADTLVAAAHDNGLHVLFTVAHVLDDALLASETAAAWLASVQLVVLEDVHVMGVRSELAIGLLRRALSDSRATAVRWVATSVSLESAAALQSWLGLTHVYNFGAHDRPSSLRTTVTSFDVAHSLHFLKAMIKPTYDAVRLATGRSGRAIAVVPSRAQAMGVARDLVRQAASSSADDDAHPSTFIGARTTADELEPYVAALQDKSGLGEVLLGGVGVLTDATAASDRRTVLALYASGTIRALVVSRDVCWSLHDVHCRCVVIMGTQCMRLDDAQMHIEAMFDVTNLSAAKGHARLVEYAPSDVLRMQSFATSPNAAAKQYDDEYDEEDEARAHECVVLCQAEQASLLRRMLDGGGGYLLESQWLHATIGNGDEEQGTSTDATLLWFVVRLMAVGRVRSTADTLKQLQWTYARHRMAHNPSYYGAASGGEEDVQDRLLGAADECTRELIALRCVAIDGATLALTALGARLAASSLVALARLQTLVRQYARNGDATARQLVGCQAVRRFRLAHDDNSAALHRVLDATRSCTPSDVLARFDVPRVARKLAGSDAAADVVDNGVALTEAQQKALLLAVFFAVPHAVRTPAEAAQIKSKSTTVSRAAAKKAAASAAADSKGAATMTQTTPSAIDAQEEQAFVRVRDRLHADMCALLHSIVRP